MPAGNEAHFLESKIRRLNHNGILYRKVEILGECFRLYLQSTDGRDSYNGITIHAVYVVGRQAFQKVWMVSNRVMGAEYPLEEVTGRWWRERFG